MFGALPRDLPRWPWWLAIAAPAAAMVAAMIGGLLAALLLALVGADPDGSAAEVVMPVGAAAAVAAALAVLLHRLGAKRPADIGLRPVPPRLLAVALGIGATVMAIAIAIATAAGAFAFPAIPDSLSEADPFSRGSDDLTDVHFGVGVLAVLAATTFGIVVIELLARGIVFPALSRVMPVAVAALVIAGLAFLSALSSGAGIAVPLALAAFNLINCWLFAQTGSTVPGVLITAGGAGALLAANFQWSGIAIAGTGCLGVLMAALYVAPAVWGRFNAA